MTDNTLAIAVMFIYLSILIALLLLRVGDQEDRITKLEQKDRKP